MQQPYNFRTTEHKNPKQVIAADFSDKLMTLKQSQGHQTQNGNVDPKQGYNHANFKSLKDLALMVSEKNPTFRFFKGGNM